MIPCTVAVVDVPGGAVLGRLVRAGAVAVRAVEIVNKLKRNKERAGNMEERKER